MRTLRYPEDVACGTRGLAVRAKVGSSAAKALGVRPRPALRWSRGLAVRAKVGSSAAMALGVRPWPALRRSPRPRQW